LSVFVVLRKIVFFSAALAQISTAGMALAFLMGFHPTVTALVLTFIAVLLFAIMSFNGQIPQDSVLGISYVAAFALGILFIAKAAQGLDELQHLLQGNILTITKSQIYMLFTLLVGVGIVHILFHKELMFVSFDREMAETQGYNANVWNLVLYFTIGLVITLGIRISGALLIFGFLVIPAVIALLLVRKIKWIFLISIITGLSSVFIGLVLSFRLDLPSGPSIVTVLVIFLLIVLLSRAVVLKSQRF
jgi:ABC-type Mn2+/Zn2+ transport system permease subunit